MNIFWTLSFISLLISFIPPYAIPALEGKSVSLTWIPNIHENDSSWKYWLFVVSWNCFNLGLIQIVSRWNSNDFELSWRKNFVSSILLYSWYILWNMTMLKLNHTDLTIYFFLGGGLLWNVMNTYHAFYIKNKSFTIAVSFSFLINIINISTHFMKHCDSCDYANWYWLNTLFQYIFAGSMLVPAWYYIIDEEAQSNSIELIQTSKNRDLF